MPQAVDALIGSHIFVTKMKELEARLSVALRYIADAEAIVARQRERIAKLEVAGCPTRDAENVLDIFIGTLDVLHDHARRLQDELHSSRM
jgi:hypothetical protein